MNMGQRDAFSSDDVLKINKMYKCPDTSGSEPKPPLNSHNNINELIDEEELTSAPSPATTTKKPSGATSRPNRPLLNLFGNLIGAALNQGK